MAFPTIPTVADGRVLFVNQLNTTATRTFPSLSSLTKNAGDLLIAICVGYNTSTGTNAAFASWGGGFTEFHDSATNGTMPVGMAYKWSTGSESGTFTVTQAGTITGDASLILLSIAGAHPSTPPEAGSRASGTSAAADPASFNPAGWDVEDTLWISVVGSGMTSTTGSWTATGTTAPANYTNRVDTNAADVAIGDVEAAVAFRQLAAASEDVGTAGVDTSNARNAAVVVAVRPAAPPNEGAVTGAIGWAGSATGVSVHAGSSSGSIGWAGSATGEFPVVTIPEGSASGSISWAGTATGTATRSGDATGSLLWAGIVTGAAIHAGAVTGTLGWSGMATGAATHEGVSTGTITWVGTAAGEMPGVGPREGFAEGTVGWAGIAVGGTVHEGAATGTLDRAGVSDGRSYHESGAVGAFTWVGSATGRQPSQVIYRVFAETVVRNRVEGGHGRGGDVTTGGHPVTVEGG